MIHSSFFKQLRKESELFHEGRDALIGISRRILTASKQAIFACQREDQQGAKRLLEGAEADIALAQRWMKKHPLLSSEGSIRAALEEYVEAKYFWMLLEGKKIDRLKHLSLDYEILLGGLCDLTGELVRYSVLAVTRGKTAEVRIYDAHVEAILGELLKMDLTGKLRQKFDDAKRNLKRMEGILYDLTIKSRS
jgi:predicted translin family RNA/ssDNA-binding protein